METFDEPIMESEEEQHHYDEHTSVSEDKTDETTDKTTVTCTDLGQYLKFQEQIFKRTGYSLYKLNCINNGFIYDKTNTIFY